jgi:predicted PurR-regulated permease PerM
MVVFFAAALYVLREAADLLAPVLVSVLLAYTLQPIVDVLTRWRVFRPAAVIVTYGLAAVVIVAGGRLAKRQAVAFLNALPSTVAAIKEATQTDADGSGASGSIKKLQRAASDVGATIQHAAGTPQGGGIRVVIDQHVDVRDYLLGAWTHVVATGAQLLTIAVLTFVLLLAGERMKFKLVRAGGRHLEQRMITADVIRVIDRQIQRYLVARVGISLIVAAATAAGMWWLDVHQPLLLGLVAGLLNVLPFVGPAVAVAICAVAAFVQFHTAGVALEAGAAATVVAALEGNLITPWLTSRAGELNTVAVFVSVLFWGWMWDMWGLLLAVPIMVSVKAAADHIESLQPLGELLGE